VTDDARYFRASREANRAWLATQPQLVICGVLDQADAGTDNPVGVGLIERAPALPNLPGGALGTPPRKGQ
jgi:hypothetical protein